MVSTATRAIPNNLPNPAPIQVPYQEVTEAGAITIPAGVVVINAGSGIAVTLAAPTVSGLVLHVSSKTAQAHTLDLASSGISGGSADVGTFGGAIGDGVTLFSYDGHWYQSGNVNVSWA